MSQQKNYEDQTHYSKAAKFAAAGTLAAVALLGMKSAEAINDYNVEHPGTSSYQEEHDRLLGNTNSAEPLGTPVSASESVEQDTL